MKLAICHLYPELMNTYGDRGNIITLAKRASWRGIDIQVSSVSIGSTFDYKEYDLFFFGGGQDKDQKLIAEDLLTQKKQVIEDAVESGAVFLTVCGGYQLLGNYYRTQTGEEMPGIGVFDAFTIAGQERFIGNVVIKPGLNLGEIPTLVGFENHSGRTYLGSKVRPLGMVLSGRGNNGEDKMEGAIYHNAFGTYLHGPLLPKNPHFADYLIKLAINRRYGEVDFPPLNDNIELKAHRSVVSTLIS
ncbi:MAG TPA: glutamine amidotransferase [Bacillota bacterium]|nr:glutamine amidotransferase [Bacillota bacterium]